MPTEDYLYLPDECWESVFKLLGHHRYLEPLSLVCKQFLSITNRLRSSLMICDPTLPYLPRLVTRFPTLTSLHLSRSRGDLHALLHQISLSPPHLTHLHSLNISKCNIVRVQRMEGEAKSNVNCFSILKMILEHFELLTSHPVPYFIMPLHIIGNYFPFLEELDISFLKGPIYDDIDVKALSLALPKLRKVNLSGNPFINNSSIFDLCKNCEFLEQVVIFGCYRCITCDGIASAIKTRPNLTSFSFSVSNDYTTRLSSEFIASLVSLKSLTCIELPFSTISDEMLFSIAEEGLPLRKLVLRGCYRYSYAGIFCLLSKCKLVQHLDLQYGLFLEDEHISKLSVFLANLMSINLSGCTKLTNLSFFALTRHCPLLSEIDMGRSSMGGSRVGDSLMDLVVNSQMKSLHLAGNRWLRDEDIKIFALVCPNLQLLDLSSCPGISKGVVEVLKRCPKIRRLNLAHNKGVKLLFGRMNFQVPMLEVLNLSYSRIDDEALFIISQSFCWLLHLEMKHCSEITAEGIRQVVENCKQLREINLQGCHEVAADVVDWMIFSRPSLRKVMTPHSIGVIERQILRHGCVVSE